MQKQIECSSHIWCTRQIYSNICVCTHGQRHGKYVRLLPPVRAGEGMLLTANGASIMETQYKYALIDNILGISNVEVVLTFNVSIH